MNNLDEMSTVVFEEFIHDGITEWIVIGIFLEEKDAILFMESRKDENLKMTGFHYVASVEIEV